MSIEPKKNEKKVLRFSHFFIQVEKQTKKPPTLINSHSASPCVDFIKEVLHAKIYLVSNYFFCFNTVICGYWPQHKILAYRSFFHDHFI